MPVAPALWHMPVLWAICVSLPVQHDGRACNPMIMLDVDRSDRHSKRHSYCHFSHVNDKRKTKLHTSSPRRPYALSNSSLAAAEPAFLASSTIACDWAADRSGYLVARSESFVVGTRQVGQGRKPPNPRISAIIHLKENQHSITVSNISLTVLHSQQTGWG